MPLNPLLDPTRRLVIGHRGTRGEAPENTLPGFLLAREQGADALELDVQLTGDGVPVVLHDPTLDRTTDLRGPVSERSFEEVLRGDAGYRFTPDGRTFPWRGRGVTVPTLAEVLAALPDMPLLVELKSAAVGPAVRRLLEATGAAARCVVAAFHDAALAPFVGAPFTRGASRAQTARAWALALIGLVHRQGRYDLLAVPERWHGLPVPTRRLIGCARAAGRPVQVWTVNDPTVARRLWSRGVSGIITDYPGRLVAERPGGTVPGRG
jgi:glycerophosphoryl diester phosphodiesterase